MIVRALTALSVVPFVLGAAAAPAQHRDVVFGFTDAAIDEASALVALPGGLFATTNDSGDTGRVFAVDAHGDTVGVTRWGDATDVEALAAAPDGRIWVGDIGDNRSVRPSVQVAEVPVGRGDRTVTPTVYDLVYPDGSHDAETLLCDPATGRLYVATKQWAGGVLYAAPRRLSAAHPNRLRKVAAVLPIATDGVFLPDGRHVIIRGYPSATVYRWPSMRPVRSLAMPVQPQGEGIAVTAPTASAVGQVLVSSEGLHSKVLRVALPAGLRRTLGLARLPASSSGASTASTGSTPSPSPAPGTDSSAPGTDSTAPRADSAGKETGHEWWPWLIVAVVGAGAAGAIWRVTRCPPR
ncbi:MAG: hypothetical protein QM638_00295 [Nocardioides sp.]|uniref:hypothetical protein n=1 Tax=Nocardioides sp. TaxID=35761 RepID=UPI0039E6A334